VKARLRIAVAGLGRMGQLHAAQIAALADRAELVSICDPRSEARGEAERRWGVAGYPDLAALLARGAPDALVVATPAAERSPLITEAASRGIPIFCEKPLALTLEDAHAAARAVASRGVLFQIGFQRRFDASYRRARRLLEEGSIGDPIMFKAVARDAWEPTLEYARVDVSGGLFVDMAVHDFDLARWFMSSEVARVSAEGSSLLYPQLPTVGDLDSGVCNLVFRSGALGNVEASRAGTYGYDIRTEIVGTRGSLTVGAVEDASVVAAGPGGFGRRAVSGFAERFHASYGAEIIAFLDCVAAQREPECGIRDGVAALEIALAARQSAETHAPVELTRSGAAG